MRHEITRERTNLGPGSGVGREPPAKATGRFPRKSARRLRHYRTLARLHLDPFQWSTF